MLSLVHEYSYLYRDRERINTVQTTPQKANNTSQPSYQQYKEEKPPHENMTRKNKSSKTINIKRNQ
jgi:hypothetical protein